MSCPKTKIYAGLSLSAEEARQELPNADFAMPIRRYDILRDIDHGYETIAIIDGQFFHSLTVTPDEIMDALRCGLRVYGSSSMGALRAAELAEYGMIGHGKIFDLVRQTQSFRDDFVAQSFEEGRPQNATIPYVDFHFALERSVSVGRIAEHQARVLSQIYADLYFAQRGQGFLIAEIKRRYEGSLDLLAAVDAVFSDFRSQKNLDANDLLRKIKSDLIEIRNVNDILWAMRRSGSELGSSTR